MALNYGGVKSKKEADAKQPTLSQFFKDPVLQTVELNRPTIVSPSASIASGRLREAQRQGKRLSETISADVDSTPEELTKILDDFCCRNEEASSIFFEVWITRGDLRRKGFCIIMGWWLDKTMIGCLVV